MKPRIESAPLTVEDRNIWVYQVCAHWWNRERSYRGIFTSTRLSDRRDADLMWQAQRHRDQTFPVDQPPIVLITLRGEVNCGGARW